MTFVFFKSIEVDQRNNDLLWINEHFYDKEEIDYIYLNKKDNIHSKLHIELLKHTSVFCILYSLSKFFKNRKIKVRNLTNYSYVDCFER